MTTRDEIRPLTMGELETVCRALADTTQGLIGSEIGLVLRLSMPIENAHFC